MLTCNMYTFIVMISCKKGHVSRTCSCISRNATHAEYQRNDGISPLMIVLPPKNSHPIKVQHFVSEWLKNPSQKAYTISKLSYRCDLAPTQSMWHKTFIWCNNQTTCMNQNAEPYWT